MTEKFYILNQRHSGLPKLTAAQPQTGLTLRISGYTNLNHVKYQDHSHGLDRMVGMGIMLTDMQFWNSNRFGQIIVVKLLPLVVSD